MAYIYQKAVGNEYEQCLILGMREALVYPLNLGTWKDIRVGYYYSFTSSGASNDTALDETVVGGKTNYKLGGYWGFKDSGTGFPSQTGVFIGIGQIPNAGQGTFGESYFNPSSNGWALAHNGGSTNLTYFSIDTSNSPFWTTRNSLALPSPATMVGTGTYCGYYSQKLVNTVNANGKTGLMYYDYTENNIAQPYNITGLRAKILGTTYSSSLVSGYCTSNFNGTTGNNVDLPQNLFFYMPQLKNRIRFHAIFVEKIA